MLDIGFHLMNARELFLMTSSHCLLIVRPDYVGCCSVFGGGWGCYGLSSLRTGNAGTEETLEGCSGKFLIRHLNFLLMKCVSASACRMQRANNELSQYLK